jgi:hypothetical protein
MILTKVASLRRTSRDGDDGDDADEETSKDDEKKASCVTADFQPVLVLFLVEPLDNVPVWAYFERSFRSGTEYLLQLETRHGFQSRHKARRGPSLPRQNVAYGLIMTILGMFMTFIV